VAKRKILTYRESNTDCVAHKARRALDLIGLARHGTVRRGKTQWKKLEGRAQHRPGSAQTPSEGIGTVPEYWTEQNLSKRAEGQYLLQSQEFNVFFSSKLICISLSWKQASFK
jgi:hypothetical protein